MSAVPQAIPAHSTEQSEARFAGRLRWIVFGGLLLRAVVIIYANQRPAMFDFPDSHRYIVVARNIAAGNGPIQSDTVRAGTDPLYPALLSIGARLGLNQTDQLFRFARLFNTAFSVCAIFLLGLLGKRLFNPTVGLIAALILACDPIFIFFNALVLTETAYTVFLLAALLAVVSLFRRQSLWWAACAGLCLGLGTLTRSTGLLLPLFIAPFVGPRSADAWRRRAWLTTIFLFASAAPLSPTLVRNYRLFGRIIPVRTGGGASLLEALGPWADGAPGMNRIEYPVFPPNTDECERDRLCRNAALTWAKQNPGRVVQLAFAKLHRTWSLTPNAADYSSPFYLLVAGLTVAPVLALALVGIWFLRKQPVLLALLLLPCAYFTLLHMVFVGSVRYRLPAMPLLFLLAAVAVYRVACPDRFRTDA